jgi:hypothetical protein
MRQSNPGSFRAQATHLRRQFPPPSETLLELPRQTRRARAHLLTVTKPKDFKRLAS